MRARSYGFLIALVAATVSAAACGGGVTTNPAAGSPTPSGTGTPTGSPTPAQQRTVCSFMWVNLVSASTFNIYQVQIDSTLWNSGSVSLDGNKAAAVYLLNADQSGNFTAAGMATAGTVSITVNGTTVGSQASFSDTASLTFFDAYAALKGHSTVLGPQTGTGGTGTFSGQLSNLSGTSPTPGTGSIAATVGGNAMTFSTVSLAGCQTTTAFAPEDRYARMMDDAMAFLRF